MASRDSNGELRPLNALPSLPLDAAHWQAIFAAMQLSPRQAEIAALVVRGATLKEVAALLGASLSTVRTQLNRVFAKTGVNGRGELLLHILAVSHEVGRCGCQQKR